MWKYYNANPLGKIQSDCFLRALSCATGNSWDFVYEKVSDIAQSEGAMMDDREFVLNYLDSRYKRLYFRKGMTVTEVAQKYSDNIVLITMKGHIVCSKYRNNI